MDERNKTIICTILLTIAFIVALLYSLIEMNIIKFDFADETSKIEEKTIKKGPKEKLNNEELEGLCGNSVSFNEDSWKTITCYIRNSKANNYNVGDTKTVDMKELGIHTLRIANKTIADACSNNLYSQTACGFVLEFEDIIVNHQIKNEGTNIGSWEKLGEEVNGMRYYLNTTIYNLLPDELKEAIIDTRVISGHGETEGESNKITTDKLYLLSCVELYGEACTNNGKNLDSVTKNETRQLDYYNKKEVDLSKRYETIKYYDGVPSNWYLRSPQAPSINNWLVIENRGYYEINSGVEHQFGVSPAFRID